MRIVKCTLIRKDENGVEHVEPYEKSDGNKDEDDDKDDDKEVFEPIYDDEEGYEKQDYDD